MPEPYWADETVTLHLGKCEEVLPSLPAESVDAIVTDPPAAVRFMGREWDSDRGGRDKWVAWLADCMEKAARVLKPGGHLLVWSLPRTSGWTQWALEDAGLEIRDCILHLFGCLSDDTEILVNGRWEPYRNVASGNLALAYNAERDEFAWEPVQEVYIYPGYSDTAYRIRGDHTDQLVTREHRCLIERGGTYVFERAEEAARQREARVPVLEDLPGLLAALPLPDQGASGAEPDLFPPLSRPVDLRADQDPEAEAAVRLVPAGVHAQEQPVTGQGALLLPGARSEVEGGRSGIRGQDARHREHGAGRLDRCQHGVLRAEDDRRGEPGMERRGHLLPQERELSAGQVRPVSAGVRGDGTQGRLRDGTPAPGGPGDRAVPVPGGSGPPRQPRPAGQRPAEPDAVREQPGSQAVRASRFTRADLARVEPVEYSGLVWCVRIPSGAFVARRNGKVFVTGNSGFPKSLDVSKAIDKRRDWKALAALQGKIRDARAGLGITQSEAARRCGIIAPGESLGGGGFMWFETGMRIPTADQYAALKATLSLDGSCDLAFESAEREVLGENTTVRRGGSWADQVDSGIFRTGEHTVQTTAPATEDAARWEGWGTALKPGQEMWWLARKPLAAGTVAANVLEWGTGALNIAGCKVGTEQRTNNAGGASSLQRVSRVEAGYRPAVTASTGEASEVTGRWPSNVVFTHDARCEPAGTRRVRTGTTVLGNQGPKTKDAYGAFSDRRTENQGYADADGLETVEVWACAPDCPVAELDRQSGVLTSGVLAPHHDAKPSSNGSMSGGNYAGRIHGTFGGDSGGASRFYPVFRYQAKAPASERPRLDDGTAHETVKPLGLMRWLVRLITPPGGTVLDLFAGSGPTGEACIIEGFRCVLIEQDPKSCELIKTRLSKPIQPVMFGMEAS